jgi:hypothetical protein
MADTKITALAAITTVDPAADVLPIVDISDTSMAASGTTKKITSNQILGAGGTATLASATITGDLTVDTSTLKVDSANNRVGIGTASPVASFQATLSGLYGLRIQSADTNNSALNIGNDPTSGYAFIDATKTGSGSFLPLRFSTSDTERYRIAADGVATWSNVGGVAGTAMTLNSTGLGVGVSPGSAIGNLQVGGSTNANLYTQQGTDTVRMGVRASGRTGIILDSSNATYTNRAWYLDNAGSSGSLTIGRQGLDVITFDNVGNVGIGVTPSAWASNYKSVQTELGAALAGKVDGLFLAQNCYYDGTNWVNNRASTYSARYDMNVAGNSVHAWYVYNGVFGSAGNTIPFTQAMTLDASGNLLVGTPSLIAGSASGSLNIVGANTQQIQIRNSSATAGQYWRQAVDSSNTIYILNNASTGVSITSGATSWSAVSDERLKDIIEPIGNAVAKVGSLRSVIGKYKSDSEGTRRSFLIAQDVQSVLPEAVDTTNADAFGVRYSEVIPLLVAAIKELAAEVNALKNA